MRVSKSVFLPKVAVTFAAFLLIAAVVPGTLSAGQVTSAYAASWSVNNNADWTPFPPNSNPLGAPDNYCTGASTPTGSWAEFSFKLEIPAADVVTGVEARFKYLSPSGTNTAQLRLGGSSIGTAQTVPSVSAPSYCSNTSWVSVGGNGNLWGTSLTAADFAGGAVSVRLTQNANTVDLDSVELIVYHESRHYASGWKVNNLADWTPFPPNPAPLGAPDNVCTGASTPTGSWAWFAFPKFTIPTSHTISGVEVRFKYLSPSGSNTAQLYKKGTAIGTTRTAASVSGPSYCSSSAWISTGGSSDLWGATLTPADFNSGAITVRLTQGANTVDLDSVEMIVHH